MIDRWDAKDSEDQYVIDLSGADPLTVLEQLTDWYNRIAEQGSFSGIKEGVTCLWGSTDCNEHTNPKDCTPLCTEYSPEVIFNPEEMSESFAYEGKDYPLVGFDRAIIKDVNGWGLMDLDKYTLEVEPHLKRFMVAYGNVFENTALLDYEVIRSIWKAEYLTFNFQPTAYYNRVDLLPYLMSLIAGLEEVMMDNEYSTCLLSSARA